MTVHALKKSNVANLRSKVSPEEWQARVDLAAAYRLIDTLWHVRSDRQPHLDARAGRARRFLIKRLRAALRGDHCLEPDQDRP